MISVYKHCVKMCTHYKIIQITQLQHSVKPKQGPKQEQGWSLVTKSTNEQRKYTFIYIRVHIFSR